jgi:hypothetical protein
MTEFISQACFLVHNEKEEFMQTARLGQKKKICGTFSDAVEVREAGSRAKRNGNAGLVWRHSSITVMK